MSEPYVSADYPAPGSPEELARFADLQSKLEERFRRFQEDPRQPYTTVVVPSQSFDTEELEKIAGVEHYEERSLFNLMLLRRPRLRLIYVTSKRLNPLVVDYYLHQMRGVPPAHARRRLLLLDCDDATKRPLTEKLLERPRLMARLKNAISTPEMAHLVVVNGTKFERSLAVRLGIPMNAADPLHRELGTKSGSRRTFRSAGIPLAEGREDLKNTTELVDALEDTWRARPHTKRMVVKLEDSFSGEGNAVLDLRPLKDCAPTTAASPKLRKEKLLAALPSLKFEAAGLGWDKYAGQIEAMGCICEEWLEGKDKRSPSCQLRINPAGEVQPISTHDQILGGPSGQVFQGATFPAAAPYRMKIQELSCRVGEKLAEAGVIGRFAVDFIVAGAEGRPIDDDADIYAVEINLRQGGTTHSFNTLKFITDGRYDKDRGVFMTAHGHERAYFSTDVIQKPEYRGLLPFDLIDLLVVHDIHVGPNETGVVFHLLGCLSELGKLGCTAIESTPERARALYERTLTLLDELADGRHALPPPGGLSD